MFSFFKSKSSNPEREATKNSDFNSLVEDAHVNPSAEEHQVVFKQVKAQADKMKFKNLRIRGVKVENRMPQGEILAKIEVLCYDEQAIVNTMALLKEFKGKICFTYVRIMGDNHENVGTTKIQVGQAGFEAMMEAFTVGLFLMTYEFRFYNFEPESTPLLAFVDSLVGNPSLQTIGFARNNLNQDMCAAILQRVYYNPSLNCVDINGNNITTAEFVSQIVKPYFRQREGFKIIVD